MQPVSGKVVRDASRSFIWLPGWSAPPSVFEQAAAARPGNRHIAADFSRCSRADRLITVALDALEAAGPEPVALVGWSLGAMVALELAARQSQKISALYLTAATGQFISGEGHPGWPAKVLPAMKKRVADDPGGVLEDFYRRMFSPQEIAAGFLDRYSAGNKTPWTLQALEAGLDYLSEFSVYKKAMPQAPAFLLHGKQDAICPPLAAQQLARALPGARLELWKGCGHLPFWTRPQDFAAWLDRCTASVPGRA